MSDVNGHESIAPSLQEIAQAIFTVNRHAKSAPDPKQLYQLKKVALEQLILEGKANKEGLHFSPNPGNSRQRSDVLVKVDTYYFHMPPKKEDFKLLPHLGQLNHSYRNPKTHMSLSQAKRVLMKYVGHLITETPQPTSSQPRQRKTPVFKPLGKSYF
ncbi:YkyB family protein [Bacillus sp. CGMCC 1.16541]|uniref:YkyB family protein n=1 Tax=Bacillus sp. CGMCC 1.16541 TaxID=2185143 RepID=UPI000D72A042|nr:YkyB family protein [Bacillus sp. CGMCC 1.16541]